MYEPEVFVLADRALSEVVAQIRPEQRQMLWRQLPQLRADELPITVLGLGAMGAACVRALALLGYRITAWTRSDTPRELPHGVVHVHGDEALFPCLRGSSIVINLLPLTPATRGLLDARFFAAMPQPPSYLPSGACFAPP